MARKHWVYASLAVTVFALTLAGAAVAAGVTFQVLDPRTARGPAVVPPLAPPVPGGLTERPAGAALKAEDGRPFAQLKESAVGIGSLSANFPEISGVPDGTIAYALLANIRYEMDGHHVFVRTMKPSPAAAAQPTLLGNDTVHLVDGSVAYVSTGPTADEANRLAQIRGDLLIIVASDLPTERLKNLMEQVVVH